METSEQPQLPQADLNFDALKRRMDTYLHRFDDHVSQARQDMITERNQFTKAMSENKENQKTLTEQIEELRVREQDIAEARAKDQKEVEDSRSAIAAYASKRDEANTSNEQLVQQISDIRTKIQQKREEIANQKQSLNTQTSLNKPEVDFWERTLGMRIEGHDEDFIKFVFSQIDSAGADKEYSFVVDLRDHDYAISECVPQIPQDQLDKAVAELNESRQLNVFLRDMRRLFKNL